MKPIIKLYEYYRMKNLQSEFLLEFDSLKDMLRYVEKNNQKNIFIFPAKDDAPELFAFSSKGGLLQHQTNGYQTLEDFKQADLHAFPDAANFYEAQKLGFVKYTEYKMSSETGITDAKDYEEIKKGGYIEAYQQFNETRTTTPELPQLEEITNAYEMQKWITKTQFETTAEFLNAWKLGFQDPLEYRESITKEFKNYADYKKAATTGFNFGLDFYMAQQNGIEESKEYNQYLEIELLQFPDTSSDQKLMCVILSQVEDGKRTSVNKLVENLNTEKNIYKKNDGTLPTWFTQKLNTATEMVEFLTTSPIINKYGTYEVDGEFFQKKKTFDRSIILDGANVAFGKTGEKGGKPLMKNILTMVKYLLAKGFTDITVFTDLSIKRRIADLEILPEVQTLCKFAYTPADKPADVFLLTYVKQNHCIIVSNDQFREWKMKDPWVAINIDYYRITFMIEEDKVLMPDLENL